MNSYRRTGNARVLSLAQLDTMGYSFVSMDEDYKIYKKSFKDKVWFYALHKNDDSNAFRVTPKKKK